MNGQGFLPVTMEDWCRKKREFMRLLELEQPWTEMAQVYEGAVNYCDRKTSKMVASENEKGETK